MNARIKRWTNITNLTLVDFNALGREAAQNYNAGRTGWGSGFGVGNENAHHLPKNSSDRRIRAWGDFLIDHGEGL